MPEIIEYCIKFSISLAMVYLFYSGFLRRLTFYHWNRWYLLLYSSLAFLVAFIDISPFIQKNQLDSSQVIQFIPLFDKYTIGETVVSVNQWGVWDWTLLCLIIGISIMFMRMAVQYFSISRIRSKAKLLLDHPIKVYQVDANIIPFSFGNSIFINQDLHAEEELKEIIRHEFIHIRQKHSVDMIWGELLCIFNWYNPFAWLIRRSIRQNLEFIADDKVLRNGVDRKQYQYLLLKVIGVSQFSIANQFNFSSLKKRIAMMNKIRSARVHLVKFLFIIPLVLVLLLAFRSQQQSDTIPSTVDLSIDTIPTKYKALPKEFEDIHIISKSKEKVINGKKVTVSEPETVIITLKDGKKETYGFNIPADLEAFEKKYKRTLDSILPHPPPPPPGVPDIAPPTKSKDGLPPPPPPPPASPVKDYPEAIKDVHVKEYTITIKRKDGKTETYDLKVNEDLNNFEKKYGRRLEDMVPCTPGTEGKPSVSPKKSAPGEEAAPNSELAPSKKLPLPDSKPVPVEMKTPPDPKFAPSKTPSLPDSKSAPSKLGIPPSKSTPSKPGEAPIPITEGNLDDLKIDASLQIDASLKDNPGKQESIVRIHSARFSKNILIIVDGKESEVKEINDLKIDVLTIESIQVLKDDAAIKAYGEKGKNGVVIIKTKKPVTINQSEIKYRDIITARNDLKQWELVKDIKGKKVFMVDKKFLTNDMNEFEAWLGKNKFYLVEYSVNEAEQKKYNTDPNGGVVNAISFSNKDNHDVYLFPPKPVSPEFMLKVQEEARKRNCLFIGIKNPIVLKVEGIDTKDLVVKMDDSDQGVSFENGTFNIVPRNDTHGTNIKIDIFKKGPNGTLKHLNTRYFRAERLPGPVTFLTT